MVRIGENFRREVWYKNINISGTVSPIYFIFGHNILGGGPTTRWHHFHSDDVTACTWEHEMHPGWFSGLENTHNKERYNLEWFLSVFLDVQCPAYCNPVVFSLLCENNVQRKQEFLERQFFAPMAATMIYYEDCMTLPGWFEHNSLLILSRTYLHDVSSLRPRWHVLRDTGTRIYIYRKIELDSSTSLSVGALFRTRQNDSIIQQYPPNYF